MKSSSSKRRVRPIRARVSTIDSAEFEDYGPEPNMKLSHAFMVVLALHVVAVGGLFAFNKVKAGHLSASAKIKSEAPLTKEVTPTEVALAAPEKQMTPSTPLTPQAVAMVGAMTASAPAVKVTAPTMPLVEQPLVPATPAVSTAGDLPTAAPVVAALPVATSTAEVKEYTIVKGDNPYKLAKRFHVSYDGLMKMNNISDPRKIQIGQKLKVPATVPTAIVKTPAVAKTTTVAKPAASKSTAKAKAAFLHTKVKKHS